MFSPLRASLAQVASMFSTLLQLERQIRNAEPRGDLLAYPTEQVVIEPVRPD